MLPPISLVAGALSFYHALDGRVPKSIAACEMAHLHPQFRLEPLRLAPGAMRHGLLGGQEFLDTLLQLISAPLF
jgi:hypothetical protein